MNPLPKEAITSLKWPISEPVAVVPTPPKVERTAASTPELDLLRSALMAIPNDTDPLDYDNWRNVLFGLHHATDGSGDGLALAHEFSARSDKYDPDFLDNRFWNYAGQTSGEVITERTLFALAAKHGWQDPTIADDFEALADEPTTDKPARFQFVQAASFSAGTPPGWIIRNVLPAAELGVLYGESGSGKSFYALDMICSIARGVAWRGHKTTQGLKCGYIAAEGAHGFRNRLNAYALHFGVKLNQMPLAIMASAPNFMEKKDIIELTHAMRSYGRLDVLVVDTLAQVTAGANENSGEDMGRVIAHCKTLHAVTGAMILLVHHCGKDASRGARGWSGIKGALDVEIEVVRSDADRVATISKMKDGQGEGVQYGFKLLEIPLGMDDEGEVYSSCVIEEAGVSSARKKGLTNKDELMVHTIILDQLGLGGEGVTEEEIVTEFKERVELKLTSSRDLRGQHCRRALKSLVEKGFVVMVNGLYTTPTEGEENAE
jgi:archaellum biogenesis ATPase FlaH